MIHKITEDFEKIVAVTNSKELKRYTKNILPHYKKIKKLESRNKRIKRQK